MPNTLNYGRGRLWASSTDYLTFQSWFGLDGKRSNPNAVGETWNGVPFVQKPVSSGYKKFWNTGGSLILRRLRILTLNSAAATVERTWLEWFEHYVGEQNQTLDLFVEQHGTRPDGEEFLRRRWYELEFQGLPGWFSGPLSNFGKPPAELIFPVVISDEGSFDSLDTAPAATNNYPIINADTGTNKFTIAGDHTADFTITREFAVTGSTGNDDDYFCTTNSVLSGGNTVVTVASVSDATADGQIELPNTVSRGART